MRNVSGGRWLLRGSMKFLFVVRRSLDCAENWGQSLSLSALAVVGDLDRRLRLARDLLGWYTAGKDKHSRADDLLCMEVLRVLGVIFRELTGDTFHSISTKVPNHLEILRKRFTRIWRHSRNSLIQVTHLFRSSCDPWVGQRWRNVRGKSEHH